MRICLLTDAYSADGLPGLGGGIETYIRLIANGLTQAGHETHVITPAATYTRSFRQSGVHIHVLRISYDWNGTAPELGAARGVLSFAWQARRRVRYLIETAGPFDIVESTDYGGPGLYLADDRDVRLVVKCHGHSLACLAANQMALGPDTALMADIERRTLQGARAIHANSDALAERCARDYDIPRERFTRVPYGIDLTRFTPTPSRLRWRLGIEGKRVLAFVGRIEGRKGIDTLVPAFARIARIMPDTVLLLAGADLPGADGTSNAGRMCSEWQRLGVSADRTLFLGNLSHAALADVYSAADVMVAPSPFEPFGLVYLEAMACGCPPVGCRTGGAREAIVDGTTGLLVPPDDPRSLSDAVMQLLREPQRRQEMSAAGRAHVAREHSLEAMVARTVQFYEGVAA
jgi:glycosyltransferase involved in cell wall biosynthesis